MSLARRHVSARRRLRGLGVVDEPWFAHLWDEPASVSATSVSPASSSAPSAVAAIAATSAADAGPAEGCPSFAPYRNGAGWCTNTPAATSAPAASPAAATFTDPFTGNQFAVSPYVVEARNQPGTLILDQNLAQHLADLAQQQGQALGLDVSCQVKRSDYPVAAGYVLEPVCTVNGDAGHNAELLTQPGGWQVALTEINRQRAAGEQLTMPGLLTSSAGYAVPVGSSLPSGATPAAPASSFGASAPGAGESASNPLAEAWQHVRAYTAQVPPGVWLGLGAVAVLLIVSKFAGKGRR